MIFIWIFFFWWNFINKDKVIFCIAGEFSKNGILDTTSSREILSGFERIKKKTRFILLLLPEKVVDLRLATFK